MDYKDLVGAIKRYGSSERDICRAILGLPPEKISERVILAPWWEADVMPALGKASYLKASYADDSIRIWDVENGSSHITYIKTGVGAPVLMDAVLALGITPCRRAVFVGSVGALDGNIAIGDIVVPEYSVSGDGASRYISADSLRRDSFGSKAYPDKALNGALLSNAREICAQNGVGCHVGITFSVDTIFAQYAHLGEITALNCNTIEMETACAFKAAELAGFSLAALLSVSDNTAARKSLISGRTEQEKRRRKRVRNEIFPKIILKTLCGE